MAKPTSRKIALIAIVALITSLFLIHRVKYSKPSYLESIASSITYPILRFSALIASPVRSFLAKKATYTNLQKQLHETYLINQQLLAQNSKLKALALYAQKSEPLRSFLKRYDKKNGIITRIFQKIVNHSEHSILINIGSREGIQVNNIAIYCNQIVGRITDVYPFYSKVMLITDHRSKVSGVTDDDKARGIVIGSNTPDQLKLAYVSHLTPISTNQLVLSSGEGEIFPEGFALGTITKHSTDVLVHDITLKPTIDLASLDYCIVLQKKNVPTL